MTDLNYTISDDYILNVSIGNGCHGGKYFCGKFDSKEECEVFYKNIKENKDKNICFETDKEGFELLSFIGLSGKYEIKNGKLTRYVSMIVCAGNLKDLFNDINGVANNLSNRMDVISPSVSVKKVAISGGNE